MSLEVYSQNGTSFTFDGVSSSMSDYQIAPDAGSSNPWQTPAKPRGTFTVTLRSAVALGEVNTLPLAPAGTPAGSTGLIFYRVYAPVGGNPSGVSLPTIVFTANHISKRVPVRSPSGEPDKETIDQVSHALGLAPTSATAQAGASSLCAIRAQYSGKIRPFARTPAASGSTPSNDIAYLQAVTVLPDNDNVLLIRAKAPKTPTGTTPASWPAKGYDLRYWSVCVDMYQEPVPVVVNHLPGGKVDYGCLYDGQIKLDEDGYYNIAVGRESQRAAIEHIPGVTFLPFADNNPTQAYRIYLRNLLASTEFAEAVQNVPANGNPASAAAVMGPYYPKTAYCPLAALTTSGPAACLGASP